MLKYTNPILHHHLNSRYRIVEGPAAIQGSEEWKEFRKGKIGASDVASILGISPFETKLECWERMKYGIEKPMNAAMERGRNLEAKARELLNKQTGREYKPVVLQSLQYSFLIASLDAYWVSPEGNLHIAEIKVPGREAHLSAIEGKIPQYYEPQLTHQHDISAADEVLYFSWDGLSERGIILEFPRNLKREIYLFKEILEFCESMLSNTPPKAAEKDWIEIVDPVKLLQCEEYSENAMTIDQLQKRNKELRDAIVKDLAHNKNRVGDVSVQKVQKQGPIDYALMVAQNNLEDLAERYRKQPITYWGIR